MDVNGCEWMRIWGPQKNVQGSEWKRMDANFIRFFFAPQAKKIWGLGAGVRKTHEKKIFLKKKI